MRLSEVIDVDWLLENPTAAIDLLKCYEHELNQRKNYIKVLEEEVERFHNKDFLKKVILVDEEQLEIIE